MDEDKLRALMALGMLKAMFDGNNEAVLEDSGNEITTEDVYASTKKVGKHLRSAMQGFIDAGFTHGEAFQMTKVLLEKAGRE